MYCLLYWHKSNSEKKKITNLLPGKSSGDYFSGSPFQSPWGFFPFVANVNVSTKKSKFYRIKITGMQFLGFKERKIVRKHAVNRKKHAVVYLCSVVNY